jgi:hypothetical protein
VSPWEESEADGKQAAVDVAASGSCWNRGKPTEAFNAYDCSNRSNLVESYSLLEPEACAASDGNGERETVVYGEIVQMKHDRIIPIF